MAVIILAACQPAAEEGPAPMKDVVGKYFLIGAAINTDQAAGRDTLAVEAIKRHFNEIYTGKRKILDTKLDTQIHARL